MVFVGRDNHASAGENQGPRFALDDKAFWKAAAGKRRPEAGITLVIYVAVTTVSRVNT
jgi:hypothetical protein